MNTPNILLAPAALDGRPPQSESERSLPSLLAILGGGRGLLMWPLAISY